MKLYRNKHITKVLALSVMLSALAACQDELLYSSEGPLYDSDIVLFDAYIGSMEASTRSEEMPTDLDPLVLKGEDKTLYLHTYVCKNSFDPAENPIEASTRGLEINDIRSLREHYNYFGVEAWLSDNFTGYLVEPNFIKKDSKAKFLNESEEKDGVSWDIWKVDDNKKYYWPGNNEMISIHSWAPYSLPSTLTNLQKKRGQVSFSYKAQRSTEEDSERDAEAQTDLLWAITDVSKAISGGGRAKLQFTHPLSAIKFAVRDVRDGMVKKITLRKVFSEGDCVYTLSKLTDTKSGTYSWTKQRETGDFTQVFNVKVPDFSDKENRDEDGDYSITDRKPEATFMMIPQTIPDDAEIEIVMTQEGLQDKNNPESEEITLRGKIKDNNIKEWKAGYEYVYTISTSSDNWEYVFNVSGSAQTFRNDDKPDSAPFQAHPDSILVNYSVTKGSYYNVESYRYRRNNPHVVEPVEWTGTVLDSDGSVQSYGVNTSDKPSIQDLITEFGKKDPDAPDGIKMTYTPEEWFLQGMSFSDDTNNDGNLDTFGGSGSVGSTKYDVVFKSQYIATDWRGDWEMRATSPEDNNTKDNPIDLSKRNGGKGPRNTANCYVVNKTGWYAIPLYYGNTIMNDEPVSQPYTFGDGVTPHVEHGYSALLNFIDYNGNPINKAQIDGAEKATLVWVDAENIISKDEVELRNDVLGGDEPYIVFHIRQEDLQQSNAIVAVQDKNGDIIWSWHIWVSEYWLNGDLELGKNSIPERNEVECDIWVDEFHVNQTIPVSSFTAAPRNLGWCDAKNVGYLKRVGNLKFTQKKPCNEGELPPTHMLKVEQRGHLIEYWIGNNTYYQWGRKDPMVGFINNKNQLKYNYGPEDLSYKVSDAEKVTRTLQDGIRHPNQLFIRYNGEGNAFSSNNWFTLTHAGDYHNLWNNYSNGELTKPDDGSKSWAEPGQENTPLQNTPFAYSAVKTVYDPSPPGYVVPPTTFFNIFVKGRVRAVFSNNHSGGPTNLDSFNGYIEQMTNIKEGDHTDWFYVWYAHSKNNGTGPTVYLTPTGQRWDKYEHSILGPPGANMNPWIVYLWSNATEFNTSGVTANGLTAFAFVLGKENDNLNADPNNPFIMTTHFNARKSMARPVRCVKEYTNNF